MAWTHPHGGDGNRVASTCGKREDYVTVPLHRQTAASIADRTEARAHVGVVGQSWAAPAGQAAVILFFIIVVLRNAWVSEDAYITFRTVDNWLNGFGLRWDPSERVQTYTHPLWLFVVTPFVAATREVFYTVIVVCAGLSLATALTLCLGVARRLGAAILAVTILSFSSAFVDYSTSGLENPLTDFLLGLFFLVYLQDTTSLRRIFALSLLAALGVLNRMDTAVILLPALCYSWSRHRNLKAAAVVALGAVPFVSWEVFSLLYYGFLFPNTAYAKLNTGISGWALAAQGLVYLRECSLHDPLTTLAIVAGLGTGLRHRDWKLLAIVVGILLHLVYLVCIGGDFMVGRFMTAPLLCATVILSVSTWPSRPRVCLATIVLATAVGLVSGHAPCLTSANYSNQTISASGVADERGFYFQTASLLVSGRYSEIPAHPWAETGRQMRRTNRRLAISQNVGYFGYFAGPGVHVVDYLALCDPLLARLPAMERMAGWRIGHFKRQIPEGYADTVEKGRNAIVDSNLAAYYDKLSILIHNSVLDRGRLIEIWNFNTGKYDHLLRAYVQAPPVVVDLTNPGAGAGARLPRVFDHAGIRIRLPGPSVGRRLSLTISGGDAYALLFCRGSAGIDSQWVFGGSPLARVERKMDVPEAAWRRGYDNIIIYSLEGGQRTLYELTLRPGPISGP